MTKLKEMSLMYQSIPSLTFPPGKIPGEFFEKANSPPPPPQAQGKCKTPALGQKNRVKTSLSGSYFQKSSKKKNTTHETEIMKNSTEMLICLEILKQ